MNFAVGSLADSGLKPHGPLRLALEDSIEGEVSTTAYRIYRWGQRVDIYDGYGHVWSETLSAIEWEGTTDWCLPLRYKQARAGNVYCQNWLVCRDELLERGLIKEPT